MLKFESMLNRNNLETNSTKTQADISVGKKLESELTPEESEKLKAEKESKKEIERPELALVEQFKNLENEIKSRQQEIMQLIESIERTKAKLNDMREKIDFLQPIKSYQAHPQKKTN